MTRSHFRETPEEEAAQRVRQKVAEADALQAAASQRRLAIAQARNTPAFQKWGSALDRDLNPAFARSRYAYGSRGSTDVPNETSAAGRRRQAALREQEFTGFFGQNKAGAINHNAAPAPVDEPSTLVNQDAGGSRVFYGPPTPSGVPNPTGQIVPTEGGGTQLFSKYGTGSSRTSAKNELVQPYLADKSGDKTHTILPTKPGEDPRLDPVYAASVFRKAGDEKTALAYEKFAATMNPAQYTVAGKPWANPHFGTSGAPATAAVATAPPTKGGGPLDVLSGVQPENFGAAVAAKPQETFGGKPIDTSFASSGPVFPSREYLTGQAFRKGLGDVASAVTNVTPAAPTSRGAGPSFKTGQPLFDLPAFAAGAGVEPGPATASPSTALFNVPEFARGVTAGRSTPAGVSRATAADFQQPTRAEPRPTTPTTPAKNIDESQSAIARFGLPDLSLKEKYAFKGF